MKVSPVGPSPLGPSIAFSPTPTTLNLEHIRENLSRTMSCMHTYTSEEGACEALLRPAEQGDTLRCSMSICLCIY